MNLREVDATLEKLFELLSAPGETGIRQMLQIAIDACMLAERRKHLGVGPYERSAPKIKWGLASDYSVINYPGEISRYIFVYRNPSESVGRA